MRKSVIRLSKERVYDVVLAPVITEKTNMWSERHQMTFLVSMDASKKEIKVAVEQLFGVSVKAVNTLIRKGKSKQFRGRHGKQSDMKRAVVTLRDGHSIDVTTGI